MGGPQEVTIKPALEDKGCPSAQRSWLIKKSDPSVPRCRLTARCRLPMPALPPANESVTPQSSKVCVVTVSIIYLFTRLQFSLQFSACVSNSIIDREFAASRGSAGLRANSLRPGRPHAWAWRSGINSLQLCVVEAGGPAGRAVARAGFLQGAGRGGDLKAAQICSLPERTGLGAAGFLWAPLGPSWLGPHLSGLRGIVAGLGDTGSMQSKLAFIELQLCARHGPTSVCVTSPQPPPWSASS